MTRSELISKIVLAAIQAAGDEYAKQLKKGGPLDHDKIQEAADEVMFKGLSVVDRASGAWLN
jgi:hypothetical protein